MAACDVCGEEYEPYRSHQKYCSKVCRKKAKYRRYKEQGKCQKCGKDAVPGSTRCATHLKRHRAREHTRKKEWYEDPDKCSRCGDDLDSNNRGTRMEPNMDGGSGEKGHDARLCAFCLARARSYHETGSYISFTGPRKPGPKSSEDS